MKFSILLFLIFMFSFSFSQEKLSTDTKKLNTLPKKEVNLLFNSCSGIEITFYERGSSVSMNGKNTKFLAAGLDTIAPPILNIKKQAYIMIMVKDDFYMDAELSLGKFNYLIFKKDGVKYYNLLNKQGNYFFQQLMK